MTKECFPEGGDYVRLDFKNLTASLLERRRHNDSNCTGALRLPRLGNLPPNIVQITPGRPKHVMHVPWGLDLTTQATDHNDLYAIENETTNYAQKQIYKTFSCICFFLICGGLPEPCGLMTITIMVLQRAPFGTSGLRLSLRKRERHLAKRGNYTRPFRLMA